LSLEAYFSYSSSAGYFVPRSVLLLLFECRQSCPLNRFIRPSAPPYYTSADARSLESLHQAFSASILFECGRSIARIASSGLQRLHIIRVRALLFLESLFQAFSALVLFECGLLLSLELLFRASSALVLFECGRSCPSNRSFGPAAPSHYSSAGFSPSNHFIRASSASILFSSGQQRLYVIRVWVSIPGIASFGHQCFHSIRIRTAILRIYVCVINASNCLKYGSNTPVRMPDVKYEDKSTVSNTRWPGIHIKRALPSQFPCL
jgi:hypothetical protein